MSDHDGLEFQGDPPADAQYLTYRKWSELLAKRIAKDNDCTIADAMECIDTRRWYSNHIEPLVRAGLQPGVAVVRSLAVNSPYTLGQLQKTFWAFHGREFLPPNVDLDGRVLKRQFRVSRPRRKRSGKN